MESQGLGSSSEIVMVVPSAAVVISSVATLFDRVGVAQPRMNLLADFLPNPAENLQPLLFVVT